MNTVDNKTEILKAAYWWEIELDGSQRSKIMIDWFGDTNVTLYEKDIWEIWRRETNQPTPINTEKEELLFPCLDGIVKLLEDGDVTIRHNSLAQNNLKHELDIMNDMYNALKDVRDWYEKTGFKSLATDTPICFSKALSVLLKANQNYKP